MVLARFARDIVVSRRLQGFAALEPTQCVSSPLWWWGGLKSVVSEV